MPNNGPVFTGVGVALVTVFDDHGHVDPEATARHAAHLVNRGVSAVIVAGTTGEASHLGTKERLDLLDAVKAAVGASVPVILGTGNLPAGVSVPSLTRRAAQHGASAALVLSPHHGDVREFYGEVVGAAGSMPVLAYHYPAQSAPGIGLDELKALKVAGLKDSSGDPTRLLEELAAFAKPIYVGSAALLAYAGMLGGAGAILAAANLEPELCAEAFAGKVRAQRDLLSAHRLVTTGGIPALKGELARRHGTSAAHR
ncbi:MAG: dihydrodipicolinate synthase family protein [Acidimicrobiales bacterium]